MAVNSTSPVPFQQLMSTAWQLYHRALETTELQQPVGDSIQMALAQVKDYFADRVRIGIRERSPLYADPQSLTQIGQDRLLPQGATETTAAYTQRLLNAFVSWPYAGTAYGLLKVLSDTGYAPAFLACQSNMQQAIYASFSSPINSPSVGTLYSLAPSFYGQNALNDASTFAIWRLDEKFGPPFVNVGSTISIANNANIPPTPQAPLVKDGGSSLGSFRTFNGQSNSFTFAQAAGELSVEAWIKLDTDWNSSGQVYYSIAGFCTAGGLVSFDFGVTVGGLNNAIPYFAMSNGTLIAPTLAGVQLVPGFIYHVAAVRRNVTGGQQITFYVNGVRAGQSAVVTTCTATTTHSAYIGSGRQSTGLPGSYFFGTIDDVRVSNIARADQEIQTTYLHGAYTSGQLMIIPGSWTLTYVGDKNAWSKFDLIFPYGDQTPATWIAAGGIPAGELTFIRNLIATWKPGHSTCNSILLPLTTPNLAYGLSPTINPKVGAISDAASGILWGAPNIREPYGTLTPLNWGVGVAGGQWGSTMQRYSP